MTSSARCFSAILLAACLAQSPGALTAHAKEPIIDDTFISKAIFADGTLWLLTDGGALFTLGESTRVAAKIVNQNLAREIFRTSRGLSVLSCETAACKRWTVADIHAAPGSAVGIDSNGDTFVAAADIDGVTVILTSRRMIEVSDRILREIPLSEVLETADFGIVSTILIAPDRILLGRNRGEWGGGASTIDRASGKVTQLDKRDSDEICAGPLNTSCDPVTAFSPIPWKPGCYAASIGMVHMLPKGRVVQICGNEISVLYQRAWEEPGAPAADPNDPDPYPSVPFFSVAAAGPDLLAIGDKIYRLSQDGSAKVGAEPNFEDVEGVWVDFSSPDYILVSSQIAARVSVGGVSYILVPR